jgi:glycosyltransferase involved in cell wall biosynthesis
MASEMKVLHCITGLNRGGAEAMLLKLVSRLPALDCACRVISLLEPGPLASPLRDMGVAVDSLHMQRGMPDPRALLRLRSLMLRWRPDVVQTWLYHADLMGLMAARFAGNVPVVWNLRCTAMDPSNLSSLLVRRACATLSGHAAGVAANSHAGLAYHRALGYRPRRQWVLPNGFDLQAFAPNRKRRTAMRRHWGVPADQPVIGMAARRDLLKDHASLLRAFAAVLGEFPDALLVLCGDGMEPGQSALDAGIREAGVADRVRLLGPLENMADFMNGLDVFCLSSKAEGFPNVLGEAMACGVPCVATDVGDVRRVLDSVGTVVRPGDHAAMARAVIGLLRMSSAQRRAAGQAGRERMESKYHLDAVVQSYMKMYRDVAFA